MYMFYRFSFKDQIVLAAIGIGAALACLICTYLLFLCALNHGTQKLWIGIYVIKNLAVIGLGGYNLVKFGLHYLADKSVAIDRELSLVLTVTFDILLPIYFTVMSLFYFSEASEEKKEPEEDPDEEEQENTSKEEV